MDESKWAFRNLRTGQVVPAREVEERPDPGVVIIPPNKRASTTWRPDVPGDVKLSDWMFGVIGPGGQFHPMDHSVSFILKFPPETTAELDELIKEAGGDATELFKRAIALYKLARDAVHEGKAVGVTSSPDCLETQFVGI
jgi:hypothetical protein